MDDPTTDRRLVSTGALDGPIEQLCWKQAPTMERCDRRKGHGGRHTWELSAEIKRLSAAVPAATEQALIDARMDAHGEGQEQAIADVNAGLVDHLIAPRLDRLRAELAAVPAAQEAEGQELCTCGHVADAHGNDGTGHCGATRACRAGGCKRFEPANG